MTEQEEYEYLSLKKKKTMSMSQQVQPFQPSGSMQTMGVKGFATAHPFKPAFQDPVETITGKSMFQRSQESSVSRIPPRSGLEIFEQTAMGTARDFGALVGGSFASPASVATMGIGAIPAMGKTVGQVVGGAVAGTSAGKAVRGALQTPIQEVGKAIGRGITAPIRATKEVLTRSAPDYITQVVAPKAYQSYQNSVNKFTSQIQSFSEKLNIPKSAIDVIKNKGVSLIQQTRKSLGDSFDNIYQRITSGFEAKRNLADEVYRKAIDNIPVNFGGTVDVRKTLGIMRNVFKGSLGEATRGAQGNRLYQIMKELKSRQPAPKGFYAEGSVPTPTQLSRQFKGEKLTDIAEEVRLSKKQFMEVRDALNSLYRENPYDRNVAKVMSQLYTDGEKSGLKGLLKARDLQKQAFQMEEKFGKNAVIKERKLTNYHKLTAEEKRNLKEIEKYTGEKFVDDLEQLSTGQYIDKLMEYNPERFVADLNKAVDRKWTKHILDQYREILGNKEANKIFMDIFAHQRALRTKSVGKIIGGAALTGAGLGIGSRLINSR